MINIKKGLYTGTLVLKLLQCSLGLRDCDDRDSYLNKRVDSTGVLLGALFGFIVYGVYGLTNWLILTDWSISMLLADWIWGACFLFGCCKHVFVIVCYTICFIHL